MKWGIEDLKKALQRKEIQAWVVHEEEVHRRERYFLNENRQLAIDQDRKVKEYFISLRIFINLPQPGRQGEVFKRLFPTQCLQSQVEGAIQSALQTDYQAWQLPKSFPATIPIVQAADPQILENLEGSMEMLTDKMRYHIAKKQISEFHSSELFLSMHHRNLYFSHGLTHRSHRTQAYLEAVYSYSNPKLKRAICSDEYLNEKWAVHLSDLSIEQQFDETAKLAQWMLETDLPRTGNYAVLIHADVFSALLHEYLNHLSGFHQYHQLPFIAPSQEFIPKAKGELLTLTLDPTLNFGAATTAISDFGIVQTPLCLVEKNRVCATFSGPQYSQYLNIPMTTTEGNLVVEVGTASYEALTQAYPQVIEILRFSGLTVDSTKGTFSSEIRLARLFDQKRNGPIYLKGGSLSGSIQKNFQNLILSQSKVRKAHFSSLGEKQGYEGPEYVLLTDVCILGN